MVVGEFTEETDIAIIGGGPAGYTAAFEAALASDNHVVIIDPSGKLGGKCLHETCIPSKHGTLKNFSSWQERQKASLEIISKLSRGLKAKASKLGVEIKKGTARFTGKRELQVAGNEITRLKFKRAVITGCKEKEPTLPTASWMWSQDAIPETLVINGQSCWNIELAEAASSHSDVTLVCSKETWLQNIEPELKELLKKTISKKVTLHFTETEKEINIEEKDSKYYLDGNEKHFKMAIGLTPKLDIATLDLKNANINANQDKIISNEYCQTSNNRIFTAGKIAGAQTAGESIYMGRIAGQNCANNKESLDINNPPFLLWTNPQLAWTGLTSNQAQNLKYDYKKTFIPIGTSGLATALNYKTGGAVIIGDKKTGLILGGGCLAPQATEAIHAIYFAIEMGATVEDLSLIAPPHPTIGELFQECAKEWIRN